MNQVMRKAPSKGRKEPIIINVYPLEYETTSSGIIIETIKYILYQKQQIPYTYKCLKHFAEKGKGFLESGSRQITLGKDPASHTQCTQATPKDIQQYRRLVESFENLENIFKNVGEELDNCGPATVHEVMILLGSTPMSPKEVYRIILPNSTGSPIHAKNSTKINLLHTFRAMMTSDDLQNFMSASLKETNMYIFVKKKSGIKSSWLVPKLQYKLPNIGQQVIFFLKTSQLNDIKDKKEDFYVFEEANNSSTYHHNSSQEDDLQNETHEESIVSSSSTDNSSVETDIVTSVISDEVHWYQGRTIFKGFMTTVKV